MNEEPTFAFLIGAARSGTKFLRDTLGVSRAVAAIPYDVNFFWRKGNEDLPHDVIGEDAASPGLADHVSSLFVRRARRINRAASLILEKTVSNSLRVPFVDKLFPGAKYVFLVRDGKAVVESSSRVWSRPTALPYKLRKLAFMGAPDLGYLGWYVRNVVRGTKHAPVWGPRYEGIEGDLRTLSVEEVCAKQWVKCCEAMLRDRERIDPARMRWVRYEELLADESVLADLCSFLEIPDPEVVLAHFRTSIIRDRDRQWETVFDTERRSRLAPLMNDTLRTLGYSEL